MVPHYVFLETNLILLHTFHHNKPLRFATSVKFLSMIKYGFLERNITSQKIRLSLLLVASIHLFGVSAFTNPSDFAILKSLKDVWNNVPPNWNSADPCGDGWDGISCDSNNRVITIALSSFGLRGQLTSDIDGLSELQILDLSFNKGMTGSLPTSIGHLQQLTSLILVGCGFSGPIPNSIGSLQQLVYLSLNMNNFFGEIPPTIGNLSSLHWLDLADNKLSGPLPISTGTTLGLDMLFNTKHFHFGNNDFSGEIPSQLFSSNLSLIHLLLENNKLTGPIPSSLSLVQTLEVIRLDKNSLSGPVPNTFDSLTSVQELYLANNRFTGPFPNLTNMSLLRYVDLSNNSFDPTDVPAWFSSLSSLTSLIMEYTHFEGPIPVSLFSLPQLQTVVLKRNQINGTLNVGSSHSTQLSLIDLQNNFIDGFEERADYSPNLQVILIGNPICEEGGTQTYCTIPHQSNASYSTLPENCTPNPCNLRQVSSPKCQCAYPYSGTLYFRAPSFSNYGNSTIFDSLRQQLMTVFKSHIQPVDSVALSNPTKNSNSYLLLSLQVFPSGIDHFNRTGISGIGFILSNQTFKPPKLFGPFYFIANSYSYFAGQNQSKKSPKTTVIIGVAAGGCVLVLLLVFAGVYAIRQKRRAETATKKSDPFALWDINSNSGGVPQLRGAISFPFEEIKRCTNNFSDMNTIGSGGYGKVYRGKLSNGQIVAIKRSEKGSSQGGSEFKNEIELLSRVHHRNVVGLVGFCFDHGEHMLVYEYIPNGSLKDSLTGKTGVRLDWTRRLRIALGSARGIQYLHDLAHPPIVHRDIKSSNILLDDRLNAKVADFGLSKPMADPEKSHVTTQVKGTMGYLDPEYYMTQELTEKSDVYSFGILLFELLTSRAPIVKGKYIVREVNEAMEKGKRLYNLEQILDPIVASNMAPGSVERFVELSLRCVHELGVNRPSMGEVVKEIESIMEMSGLNPNSDSASTSGSYGGSRKEHSHPYTNESLSSQSVAYSPSI